MEGAWPRRWDVSFLVYVFAFAALSNAFGMVPPFHDLQSWLAGALGTSSPFVLLGLTFALMNLALPAATTTAAAWLSRAAAGRPEPLRIAFARYAPAIVPLGVAMWTAHYLFHFIAGALAIVPVFHSFLLDHGLTWLGAEPNWRLGPLLPGDWVLPIQTAIVLGGFAASLYVGNRIGRRTFDAPVAMRALLPWLVVYTALAAAALLTFNLPMEMRGVMPGG